MMKLFWAAAIFVSVVEAGFAQGLPPGTAPPAYGTHAFPNAPYINGTVISELLRSIGHGNRVDQRLAEQSAPPKTDLN
jgi:hypothetical protein